MYRTVSTPSLQFWNVWDTLQKAARSFGKTAFSAQLWREPSICSEHCFVQHTMYVFKRYLRHVPTRRRSQVPHAPPPCLRLVLGEAPFIFADLLCDVP